MATISGVNNIEEIGRVPSDSSSRWLNVVLDLNGILCACERAWKARGSETLVSLYTSLRCQRKWAKSLCGCGRVVSTLYRSCRRLPPSRSRV